MAKHEDQPVGYPPVQDVDGLLYSQIGYEPDYPMRIIVRSKKYDFLTANARCILTTHNESSVILTAEVSYWGALWGSHWWRADFTPPLPEGRYNIQIMDNEHAILQDTDLRIQKNSLWSSWREVGVEQLKRRGILAKVKPGWFDAGALWQEANSHAAMVLGLCDLLMYANNRLDDTDIVDIELQIRNGCDYLARLQHTAEARGHPAGALLHDLLDHQHFICIADAAKAAAAWARASRTLSPNYAAEAETYQRCAAQALSWAEQQTPQYRIGFQPYSHGVSESFTPPLEHRTSDLLMMLQASFDLAILDTPGYRDHCIQLAKRILTRQVLPAYAEGGISGHFRTFDGTSLTEKAWTHSVDRNEWGSDMGQTFPQYIMPLVDMIKAWPDHPDAKQWRNALHTYAYDFLLPVCRLSPFLILPRGYFPGHGWLHFAGLWHGMNAVYALTAAMAFEFAHLFKDPAFNEIAYANLQWIAGLNAGVTPEAYRAAVLSSFDSLPGKAIPVSMIHGLGRRYAGSWLNIRGGISNGFGTGAQFILDIEPTRDTDGPHAFHDEEWITHAGAWLSGIVRLYP